MPTSVGEARASATDHFARIRISNDEIDFDNWMRSQTIVAQSLRNY
jgi:hypothetical protein